MVVRKGTSLVKYPGMTTTTLTRTNIGIYHNSNNVTKLRRSSDDEYSDRTIPG
jgi:hypothetical protein